jgi:RsmE family RNA methyltransferase
VNLLLLEPSELGPEGLARLDGRRARHAREVLRCQPGETVAVGVVGDRVGTAEVLTLGDGELTLRARLDRPPPPPSPVTLLLALPRPKILRKVLQAAAAMGVKRLLVIGSWKVEKAYWGSPLLTPEELRAELLRGLEQGRDTVLPEVLLRRYFKPFVEDELDAMFGPARLLLDPTAGERLAAHAPPPVGGVTLAIGPEGGWTDTEEEAIAGRGYRAVSLGRSVLRAETAALAAASLLAHFWNW